MDEALRIIISGLLIIVFFWVGYFVGNFIPLGSRRAKLTPRKLESPKIGMSEKAPSADLIGKLKNSWNKFVAYMLEDDSNIIETEEVETKVVAMDTNDKEEVKDYDDVSPSVVGSDLLQIWYERDKRKLFAKITGEVVDLDDDISSDHHGQLAMMMVDLQEKVGISASLQSSVSGKVDEAIEQVKEKSFNPIKPLLDYVQSDVPILEEKEDTIPEQINAILQEMIQGTSLVEKGVQVQEWGGRGVVFIVGIDIYDDIEQIPDENIQKVIRSAVQTWEKRDKES